MRSKLQLNARRGAVPTDIHRVLNSEFTYGQAMNGHTWDWLAPRMIYPYCKLGNDPYLKQEQTMKYASAFYVPEPQVEIYIFIDEDPSDLPENATEIIKTKDQGELLKAVEPYFILGSGQ